MMKKLITLFVLMLFVVTAFASTGRYSVSPVSGSTVKSISSISIQFLEKTSSVASTQFIENAVVDDATGNPAGNVCVSADGKGGATLTMQTPITKDGNYTITIPAETFIFDISWEPYTVDANDEIKLHYTVSAQQFALEFNGEKIADGETVEIYAEEVNLEEDPAEEPWWIVEFGAAKGLKIANYTEDDVLVNATATTDNIKTLQWCMGVFCEMFSSNTMKKSEEIVPLGEIELMLEPGMQEEGDYGVWNVALELSSAAETHHYNIRYIYDKVHETSITYNVVFGNAPAGASVTLDGQAFTANGTYAVAKELTLDALVVAEVEGYNAEKIYDADTHTFTVIYTFKNAAAIAALRSLVADAQSLYDNSTEGTEYGQYASGSRAALLEVLNAVNENITDTMSTASIDSCTAMINAAVAEFESHKETKVADTDISTLSNAIYIEPFDAFCGSTAEVVVKMKNTIAPTGFQFNMYLPDGVSVVEDADGFCDVTLSTTRTTPQKTNTFDASIVSDGSLMVLAASTKNYAFTGTDGEVVRINLDIDKELEEGEYPIILRNIELTDASGTPYRVPYLKTTMTVNAYKIGDVNADGTVSVADFSAIASHILENTPAGFVAKAADVNEDGFVSVSDLSSLVPIIIAESTGGNSLHARKSLRFKAKTNISDKDNIIYADDVFVSPGKDFTVTFNMRNLSTAMTGFQFNVTLPDGITVCKDADGFLEANLSTARTTAAKTNTFDASIVSDGTLMVLAASTKNYKFEGSDGEVVTVKMHAADDLAVGTYDLAIDRIELTDDKGTPFRPGEPIVSTISVTAPLQLATADFDFTNPASLGITPATNVDDAVEITAPITKGAVTATLEGGVEATIDADMYLLNIDKGGSLVLTATEPYKIVKVEFGGDELADISKLSATTGEFEASVWTGEADEVTFNVANTFRASANVTTIKVWLSGGAPSGDLTFTDGETYAATAATTYDKVTYTRTFSNTNWQALYIPFSMDFSEWSEKYDIAEINNFIEYDDDGNGVFDRTYLVVLKKTSGSTEPNYPYLIRAKSEGTHSLVLTDKTLEAAACNSIDCSSVKHQYTFTGTYQPITTMYANGYYAMDGGKLQQCDAADVVLGAQRWYMAITSRTGNAPNKSHSIRILVDGEDTTEIEALRAEEGTSRIYDLSGRMIDKQPSAHGVYIDGGKKIIK